MLQRHLITLSMLLLLMAFAFMQAMQAANGALPLPRGPVRTLCAQEIGHQERANGIPQHLLAAIALAESGRWDAANSESFAWPWTVMAEGKGQFLPSKAAAVATVRGLKARGVRNIDVGCMQINLRHHPDAFDSVEQAFDPAANAAYAAAFLADLFKETGSWERAAARYHSATPEFAIPYRQRVMRLWARVRNAEPPARQTTTKQPLAVAPIDHDRMARLNATQSRGDRSRRSLLTTSRRRTDVVRRDAGSAARFAERRRQQLQEWRDLVHRLKAATTTVASR